MASCCGLCLPSAAMNPCALPIIDVSCLSCPFARCKPSLVCPLGSVLSSEAHVVGLVLGEQLVVQGLVGVLPLLLLLLLFVLPPLLLEACSAGPCRRKGTRKAPIPATMRAMAPTLRLADESILFFLSPFLLELDPRFERAGYMIQRFEQPGKCQVDPISPLGLCVFESV